MKNKSIGFTLIEILVVIGALATFAMFAVPFSTSTMNAHLLSITTNKLLNVLEDSARTAKKTSTPVTIQLGSSLVDSTFARHWATPATITYSTTASSTLYMGKQGELQTSLTDQTKLAPFTITVCRTNSDGTQTSRLIIVNYALIYSDSTVAATCA